ncbi:MAG: CHAT domain-containing protein [bacterium]
MEKTIYLEITRKSKNLELSLSKSEQTLTHYEEVPLKDGEFQCRSNELMHLLNMVAKNGHIPQSILQELQQIGRVLYNEIFSLSIKAELENSPSSDLIFRIDNSLVQIPWELLFDGRQFLCEKFNIGRMVKTKQMVVKRADGKPQIPFRLLIIADPKSDLKAAYEEGKRIRDELDSAQVNITLATSEVDVGYLKKRLFNYDLIHYAGHADYDLSNPTRSGWLLEDGKFTAGDIRKMGGSNPLPWLVFSNACQSGTTEEWHVDEEGEEKIYGLANAFLLAGVQHYIGTFWKVLDRPSTDFALKFYEKLFSGYTVGQSMKAARGELMQKYGKLNILWGSYLLYGDPGVRYFEPSTQAKDSVDLTESPIDLSAIVASQQKVNLYQNLRTRSGDEEKAEPWYEEKKDVSSKGRNFLGAAILVILIVCLGFFIVLRGNANKKEKDFEEISIKAINAGLAAADDEKIAEFFQKLVKKNNALTTNIMADKDEWTSKPLAVFFISGNKEGEENVKTQAEMELLLHKLISIIGEKERFTVVEREYLEALLQELDLGTSSLANPESALKLGKIVTANLFTVCRVTNFKNQWTVNIRIVESETSIIKTALTETCTPEDNLEDIAKRLAEQLIGKVNSAFPIQGRIKNVLSKDKIIINIGRKQGVLPGMKFHLLKDKKIVDKEGVIAGYETVKVGEIIIEEVKQGCSYANITVQPEQLEPGMKVAL